MHRMSPGVERAVTGARLLADRLGSASVLLTHLLLALLDEDEGRPALLLERAGLSLPDVRRNLGELPDSPAAPAESRLFNAARGWSLAYRHDPEFLTDAFLLAVLRADPAFARSAADLGLDADRLERILIGPPGDPSDVAPEVEQTLAVFTPPDTAGAVRDSGTPGERPSVSRPSRPIPFPSPPGSSEGSATGGVLGPLTRGRSPDSITPPDTAAEMDAGRILDASFNRAREAARVVEDYCRFALDDRFLTEQLKELRHGLAAAADQLPARLLLASRETLRDVGISVTAPGEYHRGSPAQVAAANLKRLQEALRSLEEFGKLFGAELGRELESLRYRAYTLERAIVAGGRARERLGGAKLYVLLTGSKCAGSLDWIIEHAAAGGVDLVQLREKTLSDSDLLDRARDVRAWTRKAGVLLIVNDRPDIARLVEADGVHLGQDDLAVKDARRIVGPDMLVGVSTHTIEQVRRAVLDGADYLGVGPVFASQTKAFDHFPGLEFVRAATAETSLPAFALGGIGLENVARVVEAGARRVAVSAAIAASDEPELAARRLRAALE